MERVAHGMAAEAPGTYEQEILAAHEGEVLGHRFFLEMSRHYAEDVYGRRAFLLLTEVERETGLLMRGLLARHHIECPPPAASIARGLALAQSFKALAWDTLIVEMARRIAPAVVRFESLLHKAPAADLEVIALLVEHERALEAFVCSKPHRSNDALRPGVRYLRRLRKQTCMIFFMQ
ncbi:hypothetical protein PQR67_04800 [Paraburkholderia fungorum]|uniref:hypothetical protein n=1 Tax=Paraburkholderia fungorum TaxID=134537 RepID=UPI0038B91B42